MKDVYGECLKIPAGLHCRDRAFATTLFAPGAACERAGGPDMRKF